MPFAVETPTYISQACSVGPRAADEETPPSRVWAPATAHILLSEVRGVKKQGQL